MKILILPRLTFGKRISQFPMKIPTAFSCVTGGAVVTRSFPNGYCVLAGNPAKIIKYIDVDSVVQYEYEYKYHGYIPVEKFYEWRKNNLNF